MKEMYHLNTRITKFLKNMTKYHIHSMDKIVYKNSKFNVIKEKKCTGWKSPFFTAYAMQLGLGLKNQVIAIDVQEFIVISFSGTNLQRSQISIVTLYKFQRFSNSSGSFLGLRWRN